MIIAKLIVVVLCITLLVLAVIASVVSTIVGRKIKREHDKLLKRREFLKKELESMKGRSE